MALDWCCQGTSFYHSTLVVEEDINESVYINISDGYSFSSINLAKSDAIDLAKKILEHYGD